MTRLLLTAAACFLPVILLQSSVDERIDTRSGSRDPLESATEFLGGRHRAIREEPPGATLRGNEREIRRQFERLAGAPETIAVYDRTRQGARLDGGGEHEVFLARELSNAGNSRVHKVTHFNYAGQAARAVVRIDGKVRVAKDDATPLEYFERLILHNEIFGDDIQFEGIIAEDSNYALVTSQPYVIGSIPTREETADFLRSSGFEQKDDGFWFSEYREIGIADTKPANFIRMADNAIHPIDVVIFVPSRSMLEVWGHSV